MLVYNVLLAVTVLIGIPLCRLKHGKFMYGKLIYCIIAGLVFFGVAAIRRAVGWDYNNYAWGYIDNLKRSVTYLMGARIEKGFGMLEKLLADHFANFQTLFVVTAFAFAVLAMYYIYRYCDIPYLGVFGFLTFGLYFNSLNFLRQMLAAFIVAYAVKYIERKQFFRFTVFVMLASCFHLSALMMVVFYFLLQIKVCKRTLIYYGSLMLIFWFASWNIMDFITKYVYSNYDPENRHMTVGLNPIYMLYFGIFFILAFVFHKPLIEKDKSNNILLNCMFYTFFFEFMGARHSILSRLSLYFMIPAALLLLPRIYAIVCEKAANVFKDNKKSTFLLRVVSVILITGVCTGMYEYMILHNYNGVMPYKTMYDTQKES